MDNNTNTKQYTSSIPCTKNDSSINLVIVKYHFNIKCIKMENETMSTKEIKNDEKRRELEPSETSFDHWQQTAGYAIKQYKMALSWATKESNQDWVKKYNEMWRNIYKIYGGELLTQYTRTWQNIWEDFSIVSFNEFNKYWKKMIIEYSEGEATAHYETREKLAEDWIKTWLTR